MTREDIVLSILSGFVGSLVGAVIVYLVERRRRKLQISDRRSVIEGKLEGQRFYLKNVLRMHTKSLANLIYYDSLAKLERRKNNVNEDILNSLIKESDFWHHQEVAQETRLTEAIKDFQAMLVQAKHLYPGEESILKLCYELMVVELPEIKFPSGDEKLDHAKLEKWREFEGHMSNINFTFDWDDRATDLIQKMRVTSNKGGVARFVEWLKKQIVGDNAPVWKWPLEPLPDPSFRKSIDNQP